MTLEDKLDRYVGARVTRDQFAKDAKEAEAVFRSAERELVDALLDANLRSVKDKLGRAFTLRSTLRISTTLANVETIASWLEEQGYARDDVVREELHGARVREIVREMLEARKPESEFPEALKLDQTPGISVTGWKE